MRTYGSVNFVNDDAIGLLGSEDRLHLAGVGDAGMKCGAGAVIAGVDFHRPVAAVGRHHMRQRRLP